VFIAIVFFYIFTTRSSSPFLTSPAQRILFVIAHPDDECMFFSPTILTHTRMNSPGVFLLCLSSGNMDGLGKIRKIELMESCERMGIPKGNVELVDDRRMQDGFQNKWEKEVVAFFIEYAVKLHGIQKIVTFDERGISQHPNHIATYEGVRYFLNVMNKDKQIKGYKLVTTNLLRKYISFLDIAFSRWFSHNSSLFISPSVTAGWGAMACHKTQLLWFRYLFVLFSRYSFINTLEPFQ